MQLTAAAVTPPAEHAARRPAGAADAAAADAGVRHTREMDKIATNILIIGFAVVLLCSAVHSGETPGEIVSRYCSLDSAGARLSSASYDAISPLVTWDIEGGWDCLDVVAGFRVERAQLDSDSSASVLVSYDLLGFMGGSSWHPIGADSVQGHPERVSFHLLYDARLGWRIDDPMIRPHVSLAATVSHIERLLSMDPKRSVTDPELAEALARLRSLQHEPGAE